MIDLEEVYEKTAKYRSVRDVTTDMLHFTLIRIAKSNANMLIAQCEAFQADYPLDTDYDVAMFVGIIQTMDHQTTLVALHDQLTDGMNHTLKEIYALQVAILGELFLSDFGKEVRKSYGAR